MDKIFFKNFGPTHLLMLILVGSWTSILVSTRTTDSTCKISTLILTFSPCFFYHLTLKNTDTLVLDFRVQTTQPITSKNIPKMNDNQHLAQTCCIVSKLSKPNLSYNNSLDWLHMNRDVVEILKLQQKNIQSSPLVQVNLDQ